MFAASKMWKNVGCWSPPSPLNIFPRELISKRSLLHYFNFSFTTANESLFSQDISFPQLHGNSLKRKSIHL